MRQNPDADIYNSPAMQAALGIYSRHGALAAGWDDAPDEDRRTGLFRQKMSERREKGDEKK